MSWWSRTKPPSPKPCSTRCAARATWPVTACSAAMPCSGCGTVASMWWCWTWACRT
ncbi:UNVERIFIED_CONTAM: hypothetical protein NCL1_56681 [Trichonephila clavipes]